MTRADVVEKAARATLKYELWRRSDSNARKAPRDRKKGEATARFPGPTADDLVCAFTDDAKERHALLCEAFERAKEIREL